MRTALILNLVCALVVGSYAVWEPRPTPSDFSGLNTGKIIGGVEATPHEFKFLVSVRYLGHYCGGSIVSPEWVVTSARCVHLVPSDYRVVAGDHNIHTTDSTEQIRDVVQIKRHPHFGSPTEYENNIALLKVSPPFEFNEYVQPVILPEVNFAPTAIATVAGWGATLEGMDPTAKLMKVDVPFVPDEICGRNYSATISPSRICYGESGKDSCRADSGGPLLCGDNRTLCGIVSLMSSPQGCDRPNLPGVYTETSYFTEWIRGSINPTEEDPSPVVSITTCGGRIDASSAEIKFQLGASIRADQKCVWIVKGPYDSLRFRLSSSGLGETDGLYLTNFANSRPGTQQRMTSIGHNYTVTSGFVLVTLNAGKAPTRGFRLEFFSSGFIDSTKDFTGFARLNTKSGSFSYPVGGGTYGNNENALFVINPIVPALRTVTFTRMDVEYISGCSYDGMNMYRWIDNQYTQAMDSHCGTSLPAPVALQSGLGLVTFVTNNNAIVGNGFNFEWV